MRAQKTARRRRAARREMVPQGGLFWDGRADTLQIQAQSPLIDPLEMANATEGQMSAHKLLQTKYLDQFKQIFGGGTIPSTIRVCDFGKRCSPWAGIRLRMSVVSCLYQQVRLLARR